MKKLIIACLFTLIMSGCSYFENARPMYYAYIQKLNTGTVVKSDAVSNRQNSYVEKANGVADRVLKYKEVKEVAVFYTDQDVIVGYSIQKEEKDEKVPSTTDGMKTPPNALALKQGILQTVKDQIGDGDVRVHVAEKKDFEQAFQDFQQQVKGMNEGEVRTYIQQLIEQLRK